MLYTCVIRFDLTKNMKNFVKYFENSTRLKLDKLDTVSLCARWCARAPKASAPTPCCQSVPSCTPNMARPPQRHVSTPHGIPVATSQQLYALQFFRGIYNIFFLLPLLFFWKKYTVLRATRLSCAQGPVNVSLLGHHWLALTYRPAGGQPGERRTARSACCGTGPWPN